jgi:8-oxo-dGTP pyrophosphatase MutT (NUDIX family)
MSPREPDIAKLRLRQQYAALPLSVGEDGQRRVLLLTSRETRRWVIPKGWAEKGVPPHALAAKEAYEEAGLKGEIGHEPLGTYRYAKLLRRRKTARTVECEVTVFPLSVSRQLAKWPEKGQRETRWFTAAEAATLVEEDGLVRLLLDLAEADNSLPRQGRDEASPSPPA